MRTVSSAPGFEIRAATERDIPLILSFIRRLAACERRAHEVTATEEILRAAETPGQ